MTVVIRDLLDADDPPSRGQLVAALDAVDRALDQLDHDRHVGEYGDGIAAAVEAVRYEIRRAVRG